METISNTVGLNGVNNFYDVQIVQKLLKQKGAPNLKVDGKCGGNTVKAIINFQRHFYKKPDGLITPGKKTLEYLNVAEKPPPFTSPLPPAHDNSSQLPNHGASPTQPNPNNNAALRSYCSNFQTRSGVPQNPSSMIPSQDVIKFVHNYESFSPRMYWDHAKNVPVSDIAPMTKGGKFTSRDNKKGYLTIGYGHVVKNIVEFEEFRRSGITKEEAEKLYYIDQGQKVKKLQQYIKADVTQAEFDALFSITFNMGPGGPKSKKGLYNSTILKIINGQSTEDLAKYWMQYVNSNKKKMKGLGFRRQGELNILCQGIYKRINENSMRGGVPPYTPHFWNSHGKLE